MNNKDCYLKRVDLVKDKQETEYIMNQKRTCYSGIYPFNLFSKKFPDHERRSNEFERAKIIDLDMYPATEKKWTALENVQVYYEFFQKASKGIGRRKYAK